MPPGGIRHYREAVTPAITLPRPWLEPPAGYLDAVGGQPLLPGARQAWLSAVEQAWSDPARRHHQGRRAGMILDAARLGLAQRLGAPPDRTFLTSSGPNAVAAAIGGLAARQHGRRRIIVSAVESLAVLHPARAAADDLHVVPVEASGRLDLADLERALHEPACLVAVQAASPEVGTRQDLARIHELTQQAGVPLVVHAVQVIGRGPVPSEGDVLAASARDWAGPAGVGVLAVRPTVAWMPEENPDRGWVGGFPDIPAAAAAATALELLGPVIESEAAHAHELTARLRRELPLVAPGITVTGHEDHRLPHVLTVTCEGVVGEAVVDALGQRGFSVASGSACTSDVRMPSAVLAAMGLLAEASLRISLPFGCSPETVDRLLSVMPEALAQARS